MALVIVGHRPGAALLQRQAGRAAVERLDLRLLVHRKHDGVGGRIDIEADNIAQLGHEVRIVRQLELTPAMGRQSNHTGGSGDGRAEKVGSSITSCQVSTGSWLVMMVEPVP